MFFLTAAPPPGSIPGMDVTTFSGAALVAFLVVAVLSFTLLRGLGCLPLGAGEGAGLGVFRFTLVAIPKVEPLAMSLLLK